MKRKAIGIIVLVAVVAFYTFGTGFEFFFRFLYALGLLLLIGFGWAWLSLRGIELNLSRTATRGQVGDYLEGRISIVNRNRLPKSWLEVTEYTNLPGYTPGRGLALVKNQSRTWRTETPLVRRGLYHVGEVQATGQDPLGVFKLNRRFLEPQPFMVLPATEPLPDLDVRFAGLPSDSRTTRHVDQITTDVSSVREYAHGDSLRRIHWPYTARMNTLMVKEFDLGISADAWVVLDMNSGSHVPGQEHGDNTEELAVTVAASVIQRLVDLDMPVGLAANGNQHYILRPDSSPEHLGRLMEALAEVRAQGNTLLERFLYELQPNLSRFNTLTVVTPSGRADWISALNNLRRQGVSVSAVLIDREDFSEDRGIIDVSLNFLFASEIPTYVVRRGQDLNEALRSPLGRTEPGYVLLDTLPESQAQAGAANQSATDYLTRQEAVR